MNLISLKSTKLLIISIVCLTFTHSVPVFGQSRCSEVFESINPWTEAQQAWRPPNFTKPEDFNPQHFRFIVHAATNNIGVGIEPVAAFMNSLAHKDFNQAQLFSASIVSEVQTATFSLAGVILEIPKEKIVAASSKDMASPVGPDLTNEQTQINANNIFKTFGLASPDLILAKASHDTSFLSPGLNLVWTEVVVAGRAEAKQPIRIIGLFAHQDSLGNILLNEPQTAAVQKTSKEMNLPLVLLPPPKGELVLKAKFRGERKNDYEYYGPQEIDFFASSTEVSKIFETALNTGKNVRIVNEERSLRKSVLVSPGFLEGEWLHKVFAQNGYEYSSTLVTLKANELPGLPPIKISFLR